MVDNNKFFSTYMENCAIIKISSNQQKYEDFRIVHQEFSYLKKNQLM